MSPCAAESGSALSSGSAGVSPVGSRWNVIETRNGSNQATRQWVWGLAGGGVLPVGYVDELVLMDVNGDPGFSNTCDPDVVNDGSAVKDRRYFYHQDRNWNVVALTEYADGVGSSARVVERYAYTPYGEFVVLRGDAGSGELGSVSLSSSVGNPFAHQGLPFDQEKGSYQNRHREYAAKAQRFVVPDPLGRRRAAGSGYQDGLSIYVAYQQRPLSYLDPGGQVSCFCQNWFDREYPHVHEWVDDLPHCPCTVTGAGSGWTEPKPPELAEGHPGAAVCIRSTPPQTNGSGQQCCYNSDGDLITHGKGAGTPDAVSPETSLINHIGQDVVPWIFCPLDYYLACRPPNNGNHCSEYP